MAHSLPNTLAWNPIKPVCCRYIDIYKVDNNYLSIVTASQPFTMCDRIYFFFVCCHLTIFDNLGHSNRWQCNRLRFHKYQRRWNLNCCFQLNSCHVNRNYHCYFTITYKIQSKKKVITHQHFDLTLIDQKLVFFRL